MNRQLYYKQLLFCPGPVNLAQGILDATNNEIGHREPEFSSLLISAQRKLLNIYQVGDLQNYHAVLITGSGTAANEAILSSVVGNKRILVVSNGEFGERLNDISRIHNPNTLHLKLEWGERITARKVIKFFKENPADIIAMVHHETSTGMLNPIEKIGALAKKLNVDFVIDTVSSGGAEIINLEKCNVTFCSGSSSKAIGSIPGVSYVIGKVSAFEQLKNIPARTAYLNLYKFYYYSKKHHQTPNTPAVQSIFAFEKALDHIMLDTIKKRNQQIRRYATMIRRELKKMHFEFLIKESDMSCVLTTVKLPEFLNSDYLVKRLKKSNIVVYAGKGPLVGKVFQVGNIGLINKEDLNFLLNQLQEITQSALLATQPKILNRSIKPARFLHT